MIVFLCLCIFSFIVPLVLLHTIVFRFTGATGRAVREIPGRRNYGKAKYLPRRKVSSRNYNYFYHYDLVVR